MDLFDFSVGDVPLLISVPHAGRYVPDEILQEMTPEASSLPDTDWHVDRLYDFDLARRASRLVARWSRYVIDLNRPPDNTNLYPGQPTPELCPRHTFSGTPIYRDQASPSEDEVQRRLELYWRPYHDVLAAELVRLKRDHGMAVLLDAHSIASQVPRLFSGTLPEFNIGTAGGASCSKSLQDAVEHSLANQSDYSYAVNGRFVGGYITRHYGAPDHGIHAMQIELSQATYMDEVGSNADAKSHEIRDRHPRWNEKSAVTCQGRIRAIVAALLEWLRTGTGCV